ncbi:hypothetical protein [Sporosarcina sp. P19]|uniref:hypothetical protein n=1 Tax=Sporosarcina sp. P19 TaxID=2048258 RepID=UPI00117B2625|nr:hypothetical protein [Sporosarcina sp. P19]
MKSYIFVIVELLIGFLIAGLTMESPDYKTGITVVSIGLLIGELLVFITWQKNKNNKLVE